VMKEKVEGGGKVWWKGYGQRGRGDCQFFKEGLARTKEEGILLGGKTRKISRTKHNGGERRDRGGKWETEPPPSDLIYLGKGKLKEKQLGNHKRWAERSKNREERRKASRGGTRKR